MGRKKKNVYLEMIQWLETHNGQYPRSSIRRNGKILKVEEMSLEEKKKERSLVTRWYYSQEYKAYKACEGIPLEELPTEYEQYKEQIATLRRYEHKKVTVAYEEVVQWLKAHNGRYPRGIICRNGKCLSTEEMLPEEKEERNLYNRWINSRECKAFRACEGIPLEELPTEYEQYKERIATLRRYEHKKVTAAYEEVVQWLESHNGQYPRSLTMKDGKYLSTEEMLPEEKEERNLHWRWRHSQEYKAFKACEGIPLEELSVEYEQYKEQIATLRGYEQKKLTAYEEVVQWLEAHNGRYPRGIICRNGKILKTEEMSLEEKEERNLWNRWYRSQEYKAFKACEGIPLEELPAEYEQYKEQIATLRRYEQMRKEKAVEKRMKKSVARQVQNNASTRSELLKVVRQSEEHISELSNN